jgi:multiple sugar transport system permease protein
MKSNTFRMTISYIVLTILSIIILVPLVAGAITAFKPQGIWVSSPPVWIFKPTLENFKIIFFDREQSADLLHSIIIATGAVVIALIIGLPAAYGLARFKFKGSSQLLSWLISLRMIPPIVVLLPIYMIFSGMRLVNTYTSLIVMDLTFAIPLVIWIMRGYFIEIPPSMEECAMVFGCRRLDALRRVVFPFVLSGIIATAIILFIFCWNEYLIALVLSGRDTETLTVAAATYVSEVQVEWGLLFAMNLIIMTPIIILTAIFQRQLVRGLTFGMID